MRQHQMKGVKVNQILYHYLEDYARELKSYESSRYNCIPLINFFGDMGINQIKPKTVKNYLKKRNMKPNTMKRELDIFRSAIAIALDDDNGLIESYDDEGEFSRDYKIAEKVMGYISKYKPKAECRNMTPTHKEFNAILGELPLEVRAFVQFAGMTAYRKTEVRKLQWKDIDLKKRLIYLTETKNGEDRKTPMYRELYRFVKNLYNFSDKNPESYIFYDKNGKPFHQYSLYRRWNSACKRAGVIDDDGRHKFVLHDVRRYGVRYLQEVKGFSPEIVRLCFSGHKDIVVFERIYNKPTKDSIDHFINVVTKK